VAAQATEERAQETEPGATREITLSVFRGDPSGGEERPYTVPLAEGMVVLDAIHYIQAHQAPDLAVRWNCKAAKCGSCSAEINGQPRLMCKTRLDQFVGQVVHVRPMRTFPLIRDLVTDVSWNYSVAKKIPPFQTDQSTPFIMYQRDVDRGQEFRKCIECFLCQNICHVLRDHEGKSRYYGPRFMIKIAELEMHPLDTADRTDLLSGEAGIGMCNITKCCQEVCPEHIHITDNAIIPLKERVADRRWDPLQIWLRRRR
jgi:succinate dehydrogenase / fumarate reductase iron-sulfur subunit